MKCVALVLLCVALGMAAPTPSGLFDAVERDDAVAVRSIIAESPDLLNVRGALNFTPLIKASVEGRTEAARVLIELGADIEAGDNENSTCLTNAAAEGHPDIVKLLLDAGAEVNARDNNGMTPVLFAAYRGRPEILKMLLAAGANPTDTTNGGSTALHGAAAYGHTEVVAQLLDAGIPLEKANRNGYTPLLSAVNRGDREIVGMILRAGADARAVTNEDESALHIAARRNDTLLAADLVAAGAPVNPVGPAGNTPLIFTVWWHNLEMFHFLLNHGADVTLANEAGQAPMLSAAINGVWDMFQFLLEADNRTDLCDQDYHRSLLHFAAQQGQRAAVEALIARGADLNATDIDGRTPADLAAHYGNRDEWESLIAAGAKSTGQKPTFGKCPMLLTDYAAGDAAFWYLGHCGWAVKTANKVLVFDYASRGDLPSNPCLSNGHLCADELAGFDVYFFVTHEHSDHFDSTIYSFASRLPHVTYIYGFDPDSVRRADQPAYSGPKFTLMQPHDVKDLNGMRVSTIDANDAGVGFLVEVDGLTLYHAGDHAGWLPDQREGYTREIDWLDQRCDKLDVAFVNVTGCHVQDTVALLEGNLYTIEKLSPTVVVPTHGLNREHVYTTAAGRIHGTYPSVEVACPVSRGDRFVYRGGTMVM